MERLTCPQCGHRILFNPVDGPAVCPQCAYTPPSDRRATMLDFEELRLGEGAEAGQDQPLQSKQGTGLTPLDELLSHWDGTHIPDREVRLPTKGEAYALFEAYERTLGQQPAQGAGIGAHYVRGFQPEQKALLWFVASYLLLRRGERTRAAQHLKDLTQLYPHFPDPWIWLSATTDDSGQRIDYLESAVLLEPAHPLARDALAVAQGRISPQKPGPRRQGRETSVSNCPQCGGALHYEAGTSAVVCQYCGGRLSLRESNLINEEATLIGDLRLQRRLQGHVWREVQRVVHCQACGAELSMTHYLAAQCVFCGSTSTLVEDNQNRLEQPDGFLPFQLDRGQAEAAIDGAQRSVSQKLKSFWTGHEQVVLGLRAVYLPFWVFDGFVEVRSPAPGGREAGTWQKGARLNRRNSGEEAAPGRQLMMFDNLLFSAMDFPPPWLLKKVLPYELGALVPYEPALLADWPAALYHCDVEVVAKEAYNSMLTTAVWRRRSLALSQASSLNRLRRTFQVTTVTYQLVLLPVWSGLVQRDREQQLVLVNGQTGQVAFSSSLKAKS